MGTLADRNLKEPNPGIADWNVTDPNPGIADWNVTEPIPGIADWNVTEPNPGIADRNVTEPNPGIADWNVTEPNSGIADWNVTEPNPGITYWNVTEPTPGIADWNVTEAISGFAVISIAVCIMISVWTVVVNGIVLLCFYLNRKELWFKRSKGLLCLVFTDLCVGVSFFLLITVQTSNNMSIIGCFLSCGLFICLQLFESLQILRICLNRLSATRTCAQRSQNIQFSRLLPQIGLLLLLSLLVCLINVKWMKTKSPLKYCSLKQMFGSSMYSACIFVLVVLVGPNTLTSIIYIVIMCQLRKATSSIRPLPSTCSILQTQAPIRSTMPKHITQQFNTEIPPNANIDMHIAKASDITGNLHNSFSKSYLKKALKTIGLILVLSNISMIPYVCILTYQILYPDFLFPEYLWKLCAICLHCNSALNPFVYVMRTCKIKQAVIKMFGRLYIRCYQPNNE